jgi:putative PIN family toxin of toxin-antitoxin system
MKYPGYMKRVVIDTNVLISGLLFGGAPGKLIPLGKSVEIEALAFREIFQEYLRVLAYPRFQLSKTEIDYLIFVEILPWFEIVTVPTGKPVVFDDPADDKFVWCAMTGKADAIISGDEHLLSFPNPPIPILTPSQFLRQMT